MKEKKIHKKYDRASKSLIQSFEEHIIDFVIGETAKKIEPLDTELNLPNRNVDSLFKINDEYVLNIEFQTKYEEDIEFRMMLYNNLLELKYNLPVRTVLIYLTDYRKEKIKNYFQRKCYGTEKKFIFEVIKVWELDTDKIINSEKYGLYPLVALSKKDESLAKIVYDKIIDSAIEDKKKDSLINALSVLLNLLYEKKEIDNMLSFEKLEDLEIIVAAKQKARNEGIIEGEQIGSDKEAKNLLIRLLNKKFKQIPQKLNEKINSCQNIKLIEDIIENIFDIQDLEQVDKMLENK